MTLKRYRMEIVLIDTVVHIQARHDAGTGEWYAASEVDHLAKELSDKDIQVRGLMLGAMVKEEMIKDLQLRIECALKAYQVAPIMEGEVMLEILETRDLHAFLEAHPEYKPE